VSWWRPLRTVSDDTSCATSWELKLEARELCPVSLSRCEFILTGRLEEVLAIVENPGVNLNAMDKVRAATSCIFALRIVSFCYLYAPSYR